MRFIHFYTMFSLHNWIARESREISAHRPAPFQRIIERAGHDDRVKYETGTRPMEGCRLPPSFRNGKN